MQSRWLVSPVQVVDHVVLLQFVLIGSAWGSVKRKRHEAHDTTILLTVGGILRETPDGWIKVLGRISTGTRKKKNLPSFFVDTCESMTLETIKSKRIDLYYFVQILQDPVTKVEMKRHGRICQPCRPKRHWMFFGHWLFNKRKMVEVEGLLSLAAQQQHLIIVSVERLFGPNHP